MSSDTEALEFAVDTAKEAGDILLKYFGTELTKKIKTGPEDYATEADITSEKFILDRLHAHYPQDSIIAEESGKHIKEGAEYTWIIDPLDGTRTFAAHTKGFGVLITRAQGKEIKMVVAYDPLQQLCATAILGHGTFINGRKIELGDADSNLPLSANQEIYSQLTSLGHRDRGLSALASTVSTLTGGCKAYIANVGQVWDFAPPALLFAESGWTVTDMQGNAYSWDGKVEFAWPGVIAAPRKLHATILKLLKANQ